MYKEPNLSRYLGREESIFQSDINFLSDDINEIIKTSSILIIGAAGSVGQSVSKEIFKRNPRKLHLVDISENNMTELVRDLRSSFGYTKGEFKTFILDIGSIEFEIFFSENSDYDYVLNLSALKHVRSEKDKYTLMRMLNTNIFNTKKTAIMAAEKKIKKYFSVSTDKATCPINLMGASKRIMEIFLINLSKQVKISSARFANVAFSDGSLLNSFGYRFSKNQPIVAPSDIRRYFISHEEAGQLCLLSCLFGENRDIFFPKLELVDLVPIKKIAEEFILERGYEPLFCETEEEARSLMGIMPQQGKWPCLFPLSDTTGEKSEEEFFSDKDDIDISLYNGIGVIKNADLNYSQQNLDSFEANILKMLETGCWTKAQIVVEMQKLIPEMQYKDFGKYLDEKM